MNELTLEALAQRIAALEQRMAMLAGVTPATRDWRSVVGMFEHNDFNKQVDAEIAAMRMADDPEIEREAA